MARFLKVGLLLDSSSLNYDGLLNDSGSLIYVWDPHVNSGSLTWCGFFEVEGSLRRTGFLNICGSLFSKGLLNMNSSLNKPGAPSDEWLLTYKIIRILILFMSQDPMSVW